MSAPEETPSSGPEAGAPPEAPAAAPTGGLRGFFWSISPWGLPLGPAETTRPKRNSAWLAGVLAACIALQVTLLFRFMGLGVFVPEIATEGMVEYLPRGFEAAAIGAMGGFAKIFGLSMAILTFVGVHAGAAAYRGRVMAMWGLTPRTALALYTAAPAAVILLVILPLFGGGVAGADTTVGPVAASASTALGAFLFAYTVDRSTASLARSHPQGVEVSRRQFLVTSASAIAIAVLGIAALGAFVTNTARRVYTSFGELLAGEVTPNDEFYKVQKDFVPPMADPSTWEMTVGGLVNTPLSFTSGELLQMSSQQQYHTLECVSNQVGGGLIGNALWAGVPLRQVIEQAGPRPEATWVEFRSLDGYDVGIPLHKAMDDGALLALFMNGERLPNDHGFPVRALIPGLYGMMNPKWIKEINLVDRVVEGYWQRRGWTNDGAIRLTAIISLVPMDARDGVPTMVGGVAFAGDREVTRVEVSDDEGATWQAADVKPRRGENAWTLWSVEWTPRGAGPVRITARAWEMRDGVEVPQEQMHHAPYPDGATGYDSYQVNVAP